MTVVNPKSISGINSITTGSGSDNLLTIHTSDASSTERVRINSSGDVIVGSGITVSPDGHIFSTGITTVGGGFQLSGGDIKVGSGTTLSPDGDVFFTGIATGNGSGLTALNASNLASGTVPTARLGSGTASSSTFLRGDSTFATVTSTTINSNTDNYLITGTGTANTLQGESGLTFDGSNLTVGAGYVSIRKPALAQLDVQHSTTNSYSRIYLAQSSGSGGYFAINKIGTVDNGYTGGANAAQLWSSAAAPMIFATNDTERVRITADGKVCINNDTALSDLHVTTAGSSEEDGTLRLGGTSAGLGFLLEYDQSSATVAKITSNPTYTNTGALLKICVDGDANANQLVLKGDGNIGINRSDPDRTLCVNGVAEFNSYDNTSGGGSYYTDKGFMIGNAYDAGKASSVTDDRNAIVWNERGLDIDFATADTLRMKINYDGNVFFNGMTNLTASSTNKGVVMEQSAQNGRINIHATSSAGTAPGVLFYHSGNNVGAINYTSSATSYGTSSDYRLKENVTAISDGITRLKTLKPYRFNFKIDPSTTVDGFLAHEVTAVPEAIQGEKDEVDTDNNPVYQGIDQSKLVPLLTAALQESITKIETLEAKVAALEG